MSQLGFPLSKSSSSSVREAGPAAAPGSPRPSRPSPASAHAAALRQATTARSPLSMCGTAYSMASHTSPLPTTKESSVRPRKPGTPDPGAAPAAAASTATRAEPPSCGFRQSSPSLSSFFSIEPSWSGETSSLAYSSRRPSSTVTWLWVLPSGLLSSEHLSDTRAPFFMSSSALSMTRESGPTAPDPTVYSRPGLSSRTPPSGSVTLNEQSTSVPSPGSPKPEPSSSFVRMTLPSPKRSSSDLQSTSSISKTSVAFGGIFGRAPCSP
mmetsp:Transcript_26680/g.75376  ORF Transcript_26680/g.75376 Transcript_26680/m.75376 type:complete len:267 (-) Transcript_26680:370-1170(-)